jgi:hypothetical protein
MMTLQRCFGWTALAGLSAVSGAYAQVGSINSGIVHTRVFNDVPGSTVAVVNKYPTGVSITDVGVSTANGFANRHTWSFSSDSGTTAYQFKNNDYFQLSLDLTLTGNPITPRKEAGLLLSTTSSGDIQFIVNTDGHEVVQFGGIGFYSFNASNAMTYNAGDKISLGITYFLDSNGKNALMFTANGVNSPVQEFATGGIGDGSTLGGYFQIVNDPANPLNSGTANFANIVITPEPSALTLLGLAGASLLLFRRRG